MRTAKPQRDVLTLITAMPCPSVPVVAVQPIVVSPIDPHEHGLWPALLHPDRNIRAVAMAWAEGGVVISGVWLPEGVTLNLGTVTCWSGTACPEPVARLLAAGAPVIASSLPLAQHSLRRLGWPEPGLWLDTGVQLAASNLGCELDEAAAWLLGATDVAAVAAWSPLRGFTGCMGADQQLADAVRQALVVTRIGLGTAARCGAGLDTPDEEAAWVADQAINARGLPFDRGLIVQVRALASSPHMVAKFNEVEVYACSDDRVRGVYGFLDQFTGRWNASRPALHNLCKMQLTVEEVQALLECVQADEKPVGDLGELLGNLHRPMFLAPPGHVFVVGDQAQAEPRGVFYFAGLIPVLEIMDRQDLYLDPTLQKPLFGDAVAADHPDAGRRRKVLKIVVIACGFGMGAKKLMQYALESWGFDFSKAGVDPARAVGVYRHVFAKVCQIWCDLGAMSIEAVTSGRMITTPVGRFHFVDGDLLSELHSGRVIVYPRATVVKGQYGPVFEYWKGGPLRGKRGTAWGGILFQHAVTGTLRDVHAGHLVRMEDAGLNPVGHTHDEAVCLVRAEQGEAAVAAVAQIMGRAPPYLAGLRLKCAPYLSERLGIEGLRR